MQILHIKQYLGFNEDCFNSTKMVESVLQRALCPQQHKRVRSRTSPSLPWSHSFPLSTDVLLTLLFT